MAHLTRGRYRSRFATGQADLQAALALRQLAFDGVDHVSQDSDAFDSLCTHVLVEDTEADQLVCCFRLLPLAGGAGISQSYSAQFYDLSALRPFRGKMLEIGRFCVLPGVKEPDILRIAWGALARYVDENAIEILFGCSSFKGTDAKTYLDTFALLQERHLAPPALRPKVKSPSVVRFANATGPRRPDMRRAVRGLPPLLRSYLQMGGWVSDHAVVDHHMNTLHVFTGLEVRAIPAARKRLLRAIAQ